MNLLKPETVRRRKEAIERIRNQAIAKSYADFEALQKRCSHSREAQCGTGWWCDDCGKVW